MTRTSFRVESQCGDVVTGAKGGKKTLERSLGRGVGGESSVCVQGYYVVAKIVKKKC